MPEGRFFHKSICCCFSRRVDGDCKEDSAVLDENGYSPLQQQMGQHEIPLEIHKLAVVIVLLVLAGFSNWATLAYIHDFVGMQPLPDIISSIIPQQEWALKLGDFCVTLISGSMITLFILHKHRAVVIRRILFIIAILYFMRTLSLMATQLPSGYRDNEEQCRQQLKTDEQRKFSIYLSRFFEQSVHLGLQDIEQKMLCGDLLFSGHTLIMVVASLTIEYYLPASLKFLHYIPKLITMIGVMCLVLSRTHYTIDVIFAYWLSVGVFSIYHAFCEIDIYRERKNSILNRLWLVRFIGWLEINVVPGKLDNIIEVPLIPRIYKKMVRSDDPEKPATSSSTSSTIVIDAS